MDKTAPLLHQRKSFEGPSAKQAWNSLFYHHQSSLSLGGWLDYACQYDDRQAVSLLHWNAIFMKNSRLHVEKRQAFCPVTEIISSKHSWIYAWEKLVHLRTEIVSYVLNLIDLPCGWSSSNASKLLYVPQCGSCVSRICSIVVRGLSALYLCSSVSVRC